MIKDSDLINTLGKRTAKEISAIKQDLSHLSECVGTSNLYSDYRTATETNQGVTFQHNGYACTISGTVNSPSNTCASNVYVNADAFPFPLNKGSKNYIVFDHHDDNIVLEIWARINSSWQSFLIVHDIAICEVPENATGLLIRYFIPNGRTVNDTVTFKVMSDPFSFEKENRFFNCYNIFKYFIKRNGSKNGVAFSFNGMLFEAKGTTTAEFSENIFYSTSDFPLNIEKGKKCTLHKVGRDSNVFAELWYQSTSGLKYICRTSDSLPFEIPNDAVGLLVRIDIKSGLTVNESCFVAITDCASNKELTEFKNDALNVLKELTSFKNDTQNTLEEVVPVAKTAVRYTAQMYNVTDIIPNKLVTTTGVIDFNNYNATDKIYVEENSLIYRNCYEPATTGNKGCCFDENNVGLGYCEIVSSDSTTAVIKTLPKTKYVRFTLGNHQKDKFYVYPHIEPVGAMDGDPYGTVRFSQKVGSGTQIVQNITKNEHSDTYNNSYDITVSPQITTDSHGWLVAVDTNTSDETGKTDMTGTIMTILNQTGYCHLGEGIFYVSGNIDMPYNSHIEGCGARTVIRLLQSTTNGYAIRPTRHCSIKNLNISGGYAFPEISKAKGVGNRHGIMFMANADGNEGSPFSVSPCTVDNVFIDNFEGGGITCHNTGYNHAASIYVTNCAINKCGAGINIDYFAEYNRFTNCCIYDCCYGVVNNGGNNIFTACTIQGLVGFIIDNSEGDKPNSSHGSCVGCSFNHIDGNTGNAVEMYNAPHGFTFSGCQFWYGAIQLSDSKGIVFSGCEIGGNSPKITIIGGGSVVFNGDMFMASPVIDIANNNSVKFDSCYDASGNVVKN